MQPVPDSVQVTDRFGLAPEFTAAAKDCEAPRPTVIAEGETATETSLVMVTVAVELLEVSAALVASTNTVVGDGSIAGAV